MQPVEHFDPRICLKTRQRRYPGFENLDPAYWTVNATLPRSHESGRPGSTDAPDENEPGVRSCRGHDGNFGLAHLVLANHRNLFHLILTTSRTERPPRPSSSSRRKRNSCARLGPFDVRIQRPLMPTTCSDTTTMAVTVVLRRPRRERETHRIRPKNLELPNCLDTVYLPRYSGMAEG